MAELLGAGHVQAERITGTEASRVLWNRAPCWNILRFEGSAFEPSGKDLLADAAGAAAAIWVLRPTAERSARRLAAGQGRWWDHALRWLDPVAALAPRRDGSLVAVRMLTGRSAAGVQLSVAF